MDTEAHLPARLPHHDSLLARADELRERLHPSAVFAERSAAYVWGVDAFPDRRDVADQVQHVCLPPYARNRARPSVRVPRVRLLWRSRRRAPVLR